MVVVLWIKIPSPRKISTPKRVVCGTLRKRRQSTSLGSFTKVHQCTCHFRLFNLTTSIIFLSVSSPSHPITILPRLYSTSPSPYLFLFLYPHIPLPPLFFGFVLSPPAAPCNCTHSSDNSSSQSSTTITTVFMGVYMPPNSS